MSSRVASCNITHSAADCRPHKAPHDPGPSCISEMFYKLIILLSGSSTVLLCSLHATLHHRYTHSSPVNNRACSSTFVIWWCCDSSLPAAGLSLETHRWWGILVRECLLTMLQPIWAHLTIDTKVNSYTCTDNENKLMDANTLCLFLFLFCILVKYLMCVPRHFIYLAKPCGMLHTHGNISNILKEAIITII